MAGPCLNLAAENVENAGISARRLSQTNLLVFSDSAGRAQPIKTLSDWERRKAEILNGMQQITGKLPGTEKRCPLDINIDLDTNCGPYRLQRLTYQSEPGSRVPAYLLIPTQGMPANKHPAVLALHPTDLRDGNRVVVEPLREHYPAYGRDLAERGFVVLAPAYPLMAGYEPDIQKLGYQSGTMKAIWDNIRGVDLLVSLPFVRTNAIGAIGHSPGGHNAIYTAVFDRRLSAVVSSCGFDSFRAYKAGDITGWTSARYMPKLAEYRGRLGDIPFDFHELLGALAPRPLFINAPIADANFSWQSVDEIVRAAKPVYELYRAGEKISVEHPECAHEFPANIRELAYDFLKRNLP
jgi:Prolyl oligopeptidase family